MKLIIIQVVLTQVPSFVSTARRRKSQSGHSCCGPLRLCCLLHTETALVSRCLLNKSQRQRDRQKKLHPPQRQQQRQQRHRKERRQMTQARAFSTTRQPNETVAANTEELRASTEGQAWALRGSMQEPTLQDRRSSPTMDLSDRIVEEHCVWTTFFPAPT